MENLAVPSADVVAAHLSQLHPRSLDDQTHICIFDFPSSILTTGEHSSDTTSAKYATSVGEQRIIVADADDGKGLTCRTCQQRFDTREEQSIHFRCLFHIVNLKRSLLSLPPIATEDGALLEEAKVAEEVDGDETDDDECDPMDSAVHAEEQEEEDSSRVPSEPLESSEGRVNIQYSATLGLYYTFQLSSSAWKFSVSSSILERFQEEEQIANPWHMLRCCVEKAQKNSLWSVLLLQSGRFAITIFDRSTAILHKVFRHYTIRAKSGGSQSSHDNKGKNANSMGATLRRRGEQALKEDVKAILKEWKGHLGKCAVVLVSIPKTMRSLIFEEGRDPTFTKDDTRVRTIPFMVNKPTFQETCRVHSICSRVTFSRNMFADKEIVIVPAMEDTYSDISDVKSSSQNPSFPKFDPPEESMEIFSAIREDNFERLVEKLNSLTISSISSSQDLTPAYSSVILRFPENLEELKTPLHLAAEKGNSAMVFLLLQHGADPTLLDCRSRPPYLLAKEKETRDSFRRARGMDDLELKWDWDSCGVPAAITDETLKAQKEKEKEKKKRAKLKKKEAKEKDDREAAELKEREQKESALLEEHKAERMAAAGTCASCGVSLFGFKPFDVFDRRCCSTACVTVLRRSLVAAAAEKRIQK